jgi:putative ABC transport system permease protein
MWHLFDAWRTDVRHASRRIVRAPLLSAVVVATLALAIAANTTIFSLLKSTVLRTLPVQDPESLISIGATDIKTNAYSALSLTALDALRESQTSFSALAAYVSGIVRVETQGNSFDVGVEGVTPEYFSVLGVGAHSGRVLSAADDRLAAVAVVSRRLANRLFGNVDPIGSTLVIDGRQVTVIGVAAQNFIGVRMDGGDDVFLPIAYLRFIQSGDPKSVPRAQQLIGRLTPAASLEAARAEVLGRWPGIQRQIIATSPPSQRSSVEDQRLSVESFARGFSGIRDRYGNSLQLVMALAGALLIVGCLNLSGLMLARGITRQHEFALRTALGASRYRLFQQTLIDGVLLSVAALLLALPLAHWTSAWLTSMVSVARAIPIGRTTPDLEAALLATAVSVAGGIAIGLLPARRAMAGRLEEMLRARGMARRVPVALRAVVIAQVAMSMMLVVVAGLFATTLSNLYENDLQRRADPVLFTRLARNPLERSTILGPKYFQQLQDRLASIPGARGSSMSVFYPAYMGFFNGMPMDTVVSVDDGATSAALTDYVTPGFFDTYAIARLRGRDFTWTDTDQSPKVAIVNERLARKLSPSGDVLGRHVQVTSGARDTLEVVGVVADATITNIRERQVPGLYRALAQDVSRGQNPMVHLRVTGDLVAAQRAYVDTVNAAGGFIVRAVFTMDGWIDNAVLEQRMIAGMAGVAALLTMTLAVVGLFGLLVYSVTVRVREIGVRIAVGATQRSIVRMVLRDGLLIVITGLMVGIPIALSAAWMLRSQLYGMSAADPRVMIGATLLFLAITAVASIVPARQAARMQPTAALRQQ